MRQKSLGVVVAITVLLTLAACQRSERTVTGSYGSGVVTGQVVMAGSGSPAGVEVSVRGSGQSVTLGADGRFTFAGLADDVALEFRRSDGIDAAMQISGRDGHVVIELAATSARRSGRQRSVRGGGTKVQQFEGIIRTAAADQIVVYTSHKEEVTIALGAETVIRKGNATLTPADLTADMRVHVKAAKSGDVWNALLVIVQKSGDDDEDDGEEDPAQLREYEGIVVNASATELVVFDSHRNEVTFVVNGDTVIRKGNTPIAPEDIQVGWRVHVKASGAADAPKTAVQVIVQNTRTEAQLSGTVTAVSGTELTVLSGGKSYTVQTDAATEIKKRGATITLADVAVGNKVKVEGTVTGLNTVLAEEIEVKSE